MHGEVPRGVCVGPCVHVGEIAWAHSSMGQGHEAVHINVSGTCMRRTGECMN